MADESSKERLCAAVDPNCSQSWATTAEAYFRTT